MHVLEYLKDPKCEKKPKDSLYAEYRLLCSGTLYRPCGGDWSKSEVARILLDEPLMLFVTSRPFENYPLELALQLTVPEVREIEVKSGGSGQIYYPDDEVVRDLAALLSLLCRRLVTVAGKANQRHENYNHVLFGRQPVPLALAASMRRIFWQPHPLTVITFDDRREIQSYNPRPKDVDCHRLTELLLGLPLIEHAQSLVAASRLYALALELIHDRPDISYQLLISSVETIANGVLRSFQPSDEAKLKHQKGVYDLAFDLGADENTAKKLAFEACKREWWATRKFKQFLKDNVAESVWTEQDELFQGMPLEKLPKREEFERTLGKIYDVRSKATHEGQAFPATAYYTGGPNIPIDAVLLLLGSESPFPPVVWFERVVNSALCGYWERACRPLANDRGSTGGRKGERHEGVGGVEEG
jgi:hypothetical protein